MKILVCHSPAHRCTVWPGLLPIAWLFLAILGPGRSVIGAAPAALETVWTTNAHLGVIRSVAFSGDGRHLASGGNDNFAHVWSVAERSRVVAIETPAKVVSLDLPPTASFIVTGGDDGAVRRWAVPTGEFIRGGSPNSYIVWSLAVSPSAELLAVARSTPSLSITRISDSGGVAVQGHARDIYSVAFSADSLKLASASADGTARIWRVSDVTVIHTLTGHSYFPPDEEHGDETRISAVFSVDFSPDGTLLLTSGADGTARLWRVDDGTQVRIMEGGSGVIARFSADGKTAYATDTKNIWFWRVSDGRLLARFEDQARIHSLAVSPDNKHLAYGTGGGTVVLARVPLWIEQVEQVEDRLILRWQGGSGFYQVQRANDALTGPWENVGGPTGATASTNVVTGTVFYRVRSLPPP